MVHVGPFWNLDTRDHYEVSKVLRFACYLVRDIEESQRNQHSVQSVYTVDTMKPLCNLLPELEIYDFDDEIRNS